jgi:hypothetical protein
MSYPGPPTDNLYKFLAVTGVLLVIIPTQYAFQRGVELSIQLKESQGRAKALSVSMRELNNKLKDSQSDSKLLDDAIGSLERETRSHARKEAKK